jgi:signal transduction histidine kinase
MDSNNIGCRTTKIHKSVIGGNVVGGSTKDDFISMASHQLGTPLAEIDGYITLAAEGYYGPLSEKLKVSLKNALDRTQVMKSLLTDLLDVSRMTANRLYLEVTPTDLNMIIKKETEGLMLAASMAKVQLTYYPPTSPIPLIHLDEQKTRQAVMNLINNAINYSNGGKVDVYLLSDGLHATFKVIDNGIGVPDSAKPKLFNKFYRADNAKAARPDGTGIGLYLVRRVIEDERGTMIFKSEQGKGSTFGFVFPINSSLSLGQHLVQSDKPPVNG